MNFFALVECDLTQHIMHGAREIKAGPEHLGLTLSRLGGLAHLGGGGRGHVYRYDYVVLIGKNIGTAHHDIPIAFFFVDNCACPCASSSTHAHKARISSAAFPFGAYSVTPCPTA